ncbi:MAG: hypothetical protein LBH14_02545 [Desulfobulbaceae bacterium]|nr:hypothetical protein [Desulfobulbaceae bacterium]
MCDPPTEGRAFFDQKYIIPHLSGFQGSGQSADPAAYDQYRTRGAMLVSHVFLHYSLSHPVPLPLASKQRCQPAMRDISVSSVHRKGD